MQRPWDRRRRHRQDVDLGAQLLEELLLAHPESLLLVDHREPEVAKHDIPLNQAMGADDDIDRAISQALQDPRLLLTCTEPG